jgi:D-glycero-beta-D-manno-heptose-7-phosphate kinase
MTKRYTRQAIDQELDRLNVLIIGDVMIDSYLWGTVERISPEAPVPVLTVKKREKRLGGAGNVIMNVKALGCTPLIASVIGQDEEGKNFLEILAEHGISSDSVVISDKRSTTVKHRVIGGTQHLLRVDSETDAPLDEAERMALIQKIEKVLPQADVVLFQDYDKGVIDKVLISAVVDQAQKLGIPTVVDPKRRNFLHYHHATLFKPNLKEIKEGLGLENTPKSFEELRDAAQRLRDKMHISQALITLSEAGVFIDDGKTQKIIPAHKREIADVSGAGDTVISIAAACVALQTSPEFMAALSNLGGGLVCEQVGVVPIDKQKLLNEAEKSGLLG